MDFDYEHETYWPALNELCKQRREEKLARWKAAGCVIGESEDYLAGGTDTSITGFKHEGADAATTQDLEKKTEEATLDEKRAAGEEAEKQAAAVTA